MYTPPEAAAWLGIAPVTLRKWAIEFQLWLSPSATQVSRGVARRYTDADLVVLSQVRAYLVRSFTYTEVRAFLRQELRRHDNDEPTQGVGRDASDQTRSVSVPRVSTQ